MFKTLIKRLFNKKKVTPTNLYYFEDSNKNTLSTENQHTEYKNANTAPKESNAPLITLTIEDVFQNDFYDFLFGKSSATQSSSDELSTFISDKIEHLLKQPKLILDALPILPMSLTKIIDLLNNKEFDADELIVLIQREPAIAAKVIELANSAFYNRNNKEISDLKSAFMTLGIKGLSEGVINGFISRLIPQSTIYFRQYGKKIWEHSLSTGVIAKNLVAETSHKHDAPQAYLIGLVCNLGDVIIYQLMIEAFSVVHPDSQPNSAIFKAVMVKNSKKLTYFIAKFWNFPPSILDVLAIQAKLKSSSLLPALYRKNPLACYIYEAKVISELQMQMTSFSLDDDYINNVNNSLICSPEAKKYLADLRTT